MEKYKYCKSDSNFMVYKAARNKVSLKLRRSKYIYEKDLAFQIKDNNKLFWSYVLSNSKTKMSVCLLDKGNGELTSSDQETADIVDNYFTSLLERENDQELQNFPVYQINNTLDHAVIKKETVAKAIKWVNPGKSQGQDIIHQQKLCKLRHYTSMASNKM